MYDGITVLVTQFLVWYDKKCPMSLLIHSAVDNKEYNPLLNQGDLDLHGDEGWPAFL